MNAPHTDLLPAGPTRVVHHAEAVAWLRENRIGGGCSVFTSLPDSSEVPALGYPGWRTWFIDTVALMLELAPADSAVLLYQTDVKREGTWVDKSYLCHQGAERAGAQLLWHKIVCRAPAGTTTFGRPAYAHLLCYSRGLRADVAHSTADVLPRLGAMTWSRAVGLEAAWVACRYLKSQTTTHTVIDPFCGVGTALAVANALCMNAVGVELNKRRAEKARALQVAP